MMTSRGTSGRITLTAVLVLSLLVAPAALADEATGSISGTVTDAETGEELEGICVEVVEEDFARHGGEALTGPDGMYTVEDVPDGDAWWVGFSDCTERGTYIEQFHDGVRHAFEATAVTVNANETTVVDQMLTEGGSISGTVTAGDTGEELEGICVLAWPADDPMRFEQLAFSGEDGFYLLPGLTPGAYHVSFNACPFEDAVNPDYDVQWFDEVADRADATEVDAVKGFRIVGVDGALRPPGEGVVRLDGEDRVATAIGISQASFRDHDGGFDHRLVAGAVVLARSTEYADALAGTPLAETSTAPVLITPSRSLDPRVAAEIGRVLRPGGTVHLLGGTVALSQAVEDALRGQGYTIDRIFGETRIETSVAIAERLGHDTVLITTGFAFPDGLAAGAAGAAIGASVVLTTSDRPHPAVDAFLAERPHLEVFAVGGPAARAYPAATAVAGETREETAVAAAETFFDPPAEMGLARRDDYPDALAGGAHIGRRGGPLLLTTTGSLHPATEDYVCALSGALGTAYIYGGTAAVSDATMATLAERIDGTGC